MGMMIFMEGLDSNVLNTKLTLVPRHLLMPHWYPVGGRAGLKWGILHPATQVRSPQFPTQTPIALFAGSGLDQGDGVMAEKRLC